MSSSWFGGGASGKTKTQTTANQPIVDPTINALWNLRLGLASSTAAGDLSSGMKGYIDKILVPSTTNTMTAAGLGRSGAVGEAVSNAVLGQGTSFIEALLGGYMPPGMMSGGQNVTTTHQPGALDWLGTLGQAAGGFGTLMKNW